MKIGLRSNKYDNKKVIRTLVFNTNDSKKLTGESWFIFDLKSKKIPDSLCYTAWVHGVSDYLHQVFYVLLKRESTIEFDDSLDIDIIENLSEENFITLIKSIIEKFSLPVDIKIFSDADLNHVICIDYEKLDTVLCEKNALWLVQALRINKKAEQFSVYETEDGFIGYIESRIFPVSNSEINGWEIIENATGETVERGAI